jgi:hypothetical protein
VARPEGGFRSEKRGVVDIMRHPEDHHHETSAELLVCITLADGNQSMVLDLMHGHYASTVRAAHAIGLG